MTISSRLVDSAVQAEFLDQKLWIICKNDSKRFEMAPNELHLPAKEQEFHNKSLGSGQVLSQLESLKEVWPAQSAAKLWTRSDFFL